MKGPLDIVRRDRARRGSTESNGQHVVSREDVSAAGRVPGRARAESSVARRSRSTGRGIGPSARRLRRSTCAALKSEGICSRRPRQALLSSGSRLVRRAFLTVRPTEVDRPALRRWPAACPRSPSTRASPTTSSWKRGGGCVGDARRRHQLDSADGQRANTFHRRAGVRSLRSLDGVRGDGGRELGVLPSRPRDPRLA